MTPPPLEILVTFFLLFITMMIATVTMMWMDQAGLVGVDMEDVNTWWGRPIRRSEYEPSGTNIGFLVFFAVLIGGFFLSILLVEYLF